MSYKYPSVDDRTVVFNPQIAQTPIITTTHTIYRPKDRARGSHKALLYGLSSVASGHVNSTNPRPPSPPPSTDPLNRGSIAGCHGAQLGDARISQIFPGLMNTFSRREGISRSIRCQLICLCLNRCFVYARF